MLQSTDSSPVVSQASSTLMIFPYLVSFMIKSVAMFMQSITVAKTQRVVMTLEAKFDCEAGK
jgi:hypothetical protein